MISGIQAVFGAQEREAILRLLIALASGGILGYERSTKGVDAGFRTHIFVCMSSCAIMLTNLRLFAQYGVGDPTRMPSQVISGVGFLGAGCILVTSGHRIKGVTTAAGLWASACLGLCIGAGDYIVAVYVLGAALLALTAFSRVDRRIRKHTRYFRFFAEVDSPSAMSRFMKYLQGYGAKVTDMNVMESRLSTSIAAVFSIQLNKAASPKKLIEEFGQVEGVVYVSEL